MPALGLLGFAAPGPHAMASSLRSSGSHGPGIASDAGNGLLVALFEQLSATPALNATIVRIIATTIEPYGPLSLAPASATPGGPHGGSPANGYGVSRGVGGLRGLMRWRPCPVLWARAHSNTGTLTYGLGAVQQRPLGPMCWGPLPVFDWFWQRCPLGTRFPLSFPPPTTDGRGVLGAAFG